MGVKKKVERNEKLHTFKPSPDLNNGFGIHCTLLLRFPVFNKENFDPVSK